MPYVSCQYVPPDPMLLDPETRTEGENARIICIDEQGVEWQLFEDSQVGDWLRFKDEGGTVDPYMPQELDEE